MESAKSIIDAYANENFYAIYKSEGLEKVSEADIILIGEIHKDVRYEQIYQDFINLFNRCIVLVEGHESGQILNNHKEGDF